MTFTNQVSSIISLQANRLGGTLIFYALQQIIISLGITIGFTFLYADIDKSTICILATGAPTMIFVTCGLACLPMQNSTAKTEGHLNFFKNPASQQAFHRHRGYCHLVSRFIARNHYFYPFSPLYLPARILFQLASHSVMPISRPHLYCNRLRLFLCAETRDHLGSLHAVCVWRSDVFLP